MSVIPVGAVALGLICTGHYNSAKIDPAAHLGLSDYILRQETHKLQIDLGAGRWCVDRCEAVEQVDASSDEGWIALSSIETANRVRVVSINRKTGDFFSSVRENGRDAQARAVCRLSPFRGLPPQKDR